MGLPNLVKAETFRSDEAGKRPLAQPVRYQQLRAAPRISIFNGAIGRPSSSQQRVLPR
jgi:hypothetical protein